MSKLNIFSERHQSRAREVGGDFALMQSIRNALDSICFATGKTRADVADMVGMSASYLTQVTTLNKETGAPLRILSRHLLEKLVETLSSEAELVSRDKLPGVFFSALDELNDFLYSEERPSLGVSPGAFMPPDDRFMVPVNGRLGFSPSFSRDRILAFAPYSPAALHMKMGMSTALFTHINSLREQLKRAGVSAKVVQIKCEDGARELTPELVSMALAEERIEKDGEAVILAVDSCSPADTDRDFSKKVLQPLGDRIKTDFSMERSDRRAFSSYVAVAFTSNTTRGFSISDFPFVRHLTAFDAPQIGRLMNMAGYQIPIGQISTIHAISQLFEGNPLLTHAFAHFVLNNDGRMPTVREMMAVPAVHRFSLSIPTGHQIPFFLEDLPKEKPILEILQDKK